MPETSEVRPPESRIYIPKAANDNEKMKFWLDKAGINQEIVNYCLENGLLYQEKKHGNAVLLGKNIHGEVNYVFTTAPGGSFASEKFTEESHGFFLQSPLKPDAVKIFGSAMEALAPGLAVRQAGRSLAQMRPFGRWRAAAGRGACQIFQG
jgi:hypothetical protein